MRFTSLLMVILFSLTCIFNLEGQEATANKVLMERFLDAQFAPANQVTASQFFDHMAPEMGLAPGNKMEATVTVPGFNGYEHKRYRQYYKELPVIGTNYVLHIKDGLVTSASGSYGPNISIDATPALGTNEAKSKARLAIQGMLKTKSNHMTPTQIVANGVPILSVIDRAYPDKSGSYTTAYDVTLTSQQPFDKRRVIIDAVSGSVISNRSLIHTEGVPGNGVTRYYGTQSIISDSIGPKRYLLQDLTRSGGIYVQDYFGKTFSSTSADWDLHNQNEDEVAVDVMYCTEQYHDLLRTRFGWLGIKNDPNFPIVAKIHNNDASNVNAFWDGVSINFGDGDCSYGPLTTLEVIGHELTHGIVEHTSNLVYEGEPGALNESLADMFGKALEYYADSANFSWDLGHSFITDPDALPFRYMADPKLLEMPAYYGGEFWADDNDVHINSSIGNLWYSMISDGRIGVNEKDSSYNVAALGIANAHRIAYLANNAFSNANTNYSEFRTNTMKAAEELFGANSPQQKAVAEAWRAVGVYSASASALLDLAIQIPSQYILVCDTEVAEDLEVTVKNVGSQTFYPGNNTTITLTNYIKFSSTSLHFNDTLQKGESVKVIFTDAAKFSGEDAEYFQIELQNEDENPSNNTLYYIVEFNQSGSDNLTLYETHLSGNVCGKNRAVEVSFFNAGCEALPAGSVITFQVINSLGEVLGTKDLILPTELDYYELASETIEFTLNSEEREDLLVVVKFESDPDPSDNWELINVGAGQIDSLLMYDFEQLPPAGIQLTTTLADNNAFYFYGGSQYYISTGVTEFGPDRSCKSPDYLLNDNNKTGTISACIDFSGNDQISMEFDAIVFRNETATTNNNPYSSFYRVSWTGTQNGSQLFSDQPEGQKIHQKIDLPNEFVGVVQIDFFGDIGPGNIEDINLDYNDVILMDNLQFSATTIGVKKAESIKDILLTPNPFSDVLNVSGSDISQIKEICIYDLLGKKCKTYSGTITQFDLSSEMLGVYYVQILTRDNTLLVQRVIKN